MEPRTKDRIAKGLGYALGVVIAGLVVFWAVYKVYNFVSLF
ncbi:MAG: hypothetical protein WKG01_23680 [Kofleriaceae bacterium]